MKLAIYIIIGLCVLFAIILIIALIKNKHTSLKDDEFVFLRKNQKQNEERESQNTIKLDEKDVSVEPVKNDVQGLLLLGGYNDDYANMSEEQKNKVMLYLMKLKQESKITVEEYKEETIKLWRKY